MTRQDNKWPCPDAQNGFLADHVAMALRSLRRWTGQELFQASLTKSEQAQALFSAPFAFVSHSTLHAPDSEPIFNYGNQTALTLFEMSWDEFTDLPSRLSAEPVHQAERARLMQQVREHGYISDYRGVRIAKSGRRFWIEQATVWNLMDADDNVCGQAALFHQWKYL